MDWKGTKIAETTAESTSDKSPPWNDRNRFGQLQTCQVSYTEGQIQLDPPLMFLKSRMLPPAHSVGTVHLSMQKERMLFHKSHFSAKNHALDSKLPESKISKIALKQQAQNLVNKDQYSRYFYDLSNMRMYDR